MSNQQQVGPLSPGRPGAAVSTPITRSRAEDLAGALKALGDPVRLLLLSKIASHPGGEACVCELTPSFKLSGPTISHHLRVLREAGLVTCERRGTWVYYSAVAERVGALSTLLDDAVPTAQ